MTDWTRRQALGGIAAAGGAAMLAPDALAQGKPIPQLPIWRDAGGQIFAEMMLNGETVIGMIDNGPVGVLLDRGWATARKLDSPKDRTPTGLSVRTKGGQKLAIAGHKMGFEGPLIDLEAVGPIRGRPVTLIIGAPVLAMTRTLFDFDAGILHIQKRKAKREIVTPSGMTLIRMLQPSGRQFPTMEITVEGTQLTADVRLGSGATLEINDGPLRDKWFSGGRPWSTVSGFQQGIASSAESKNLITTVSEVQVGPWTLRDVPVQISAPAAGQEQGARPSVVMGAELLSRFLLLYDARELELGFKPGANFGSKFRKNLVGLGFKAEGESLRVMHVAENGPAEGSGFKPDDIIASVNGGPATREVVRGLEAGDRVEFTLSNGAKRIVEAREYY